jgi:hypothetical protein
MESQWMVSLEFAISESKLLFKVHRIPLKVVQHPEILNGEKSVLRRTFQEPEENEG